MTKQESKININVAKTNVVVNGKKGVIVHDRLLADGPVDPVTGETLLDANGEEIEGKNDDIGMFLQESYLPYLKGLITIDDVPVPRFGVLSLLAMSTPIYAYDHPRFKKITNTAFTDGINVYLDADFLRKLITQEDKDPSKSGTVFLVLHELMHKLFNHVNRLKGFPHDIANIAEDMVINGKLIKGYNLKPVPLLEEVGVGMKQEDANNYYKMAEEVVAEQLLIQDRQKKEKEQKQKQKQKQQSGGGSGQGQGQGDSDGNDEEGDKEEDKNDSGKKGDKDGKGKGDKKDDEEYSGIHHITPEELIEILEEEGLMDTVGEALGMPSSDDVEGIAEKKERSELNIVDAVENAIALNNKIGGKMPGAHIAESAAETISGLNRGKLVWKLGIRKHIMGDGLKLKESDDEADIPWLLSKETMGVDPWYSGALVPHAPDETVLCLIDTSGSTSGGGMRQAFISEALALKKGVSSAGDTAREVILMSADTVIRGEPLIINEHNVSKLRDEGVKIFGNGGTDFANCLDQAMSHKIMSKKKIKSVIYFTDCCDSVPRRKDFEKYLDKGIKVVFVTTPSMWQEQWNKELRWAEVYCIEDGTEVNLDKKEINTNTRRNKR